MCRLMLMRWLVLCRFNRLPQWAPTGGGGCHAELLPNVVGRSQQRQRATMVRKRPCHASSSSSLGKCSCLDAVLACPGTAAAWLERRFPYLTALSSNSLADRVPAALLIVC